VTNVPAAKNPVQVPLLVEPLSTQLMPDGVLVTSPLPPELAPGATVSRCGAAVKFAVTAVVIPLLMVRTHALPLQPPPNPSKLPLLLPAAFSVTVDAASNGALQIPLVTPAVMVHDNPAGELFTLPDPVPPPLIVIMPDGGRRYVISALRACDIVI
jgi:hypothetical protein